MIRTGYSVYQTDARCDYLLRSGPQKAFAQPLESENVLMVTTDFTNFFLAGTGAGAALIGLLFVAVSIRPGLVASRDTHTAVQVSVAMAFTALVNGFFISFASLLPGAVIGGIALVMGGLSTWSCLIAAVGLIRHLQADRTRRPALQFARGMVLVVAGLLIYVWEIAAGWRAVQAPEDVGPIWTIANLVMAAFGLGLVRAWELLGARRSVGLLRWLSPLGDSVELPPPATVGETRSLASGAEGESGTDDPQRH